MSIRMRKWLDVSTEENKVVIQDGETPKEDFNTAANEETGDVDTAKPVVAEIDAASDGAPGHTTKEHEHMTVTTSKESESKDDDTEEDGGNAESRSEADSEAEHENKDETEYDADKEAGTGETKEGKPESDELTDEDKPVEAHIDPNEAGDENAGGASKTDEMVEANVTDTPTEDLSTEDFGDKQKDGTILEKGEDGAPDTKPSDEGTSVEEGGDDSAPVEKVEETDLDAHELDTVSKEAFDDFSDVLSDMGHIHRITAAMETYQTILQRGMDETDGITNDVALAIKTGIESLDEDFADDEVIPSLEAFGETSSRHRGTYISLENVKDRAQKLYAAGKVAVEKLFEMLAKLIDDVLTGAGAARKRLAAVKEKLGNAEQASVSDTTTLKGAARLMVGTEFVGNDPKPLKDVEDLMQYMLVDYTKAMLSMSKDAYEWFGKFDLFRSSSSDISKFMVLPAKHLPKMPGTQKAEPKVIPSSMKRFTAVVHGEVLPGNYALFQYINEDMNFMQKHMANRTVKATHADMEKDGIDPESRPEATGAIKGSVKLLTAFGDTFRVEFRELADRPTKQEESYRVPSVADMTKIADQLERLLKGLEARRDVKRLLNEAKTNMVNEARKITMKKAMTGVDAVNDVLLRSLSTAMTQPSGNFARYVATLSSAYIAVMNHNLGYYTIKGSATVKGKTGEPAKAAAPAGNTAQPLLA